MNTTCALCGPKAQVNRVRKAITDGGGVLVGEGWSHGLPEEDGAAWLTVAVDHPDTAVAAVTPFGWVLRAHYPTPEETA